MKLAIINTAAKGTEVHAAGCADVKKSEKRNKDESWVIDADSKLEVSHNYWHDQIGDQVDPDSAEGWDTALAWLGEFNFLPCCGDLADGVSPFATEAPGASQMDDFLRTSELAAEEAASEKTVSVWVGWRVADEAMGRSDDDPAVASLSAKLAARQPNKVLDRTVQLTQAECQALSAIATDLENAVLGAKGAGPVAYSCRTLRARLADAWS